MSQIVKDTDTTIRITLTEDDNTTPIDLSGLSGYVVEIFQKPRVLFDQFSKNTQVGYRDITEVDAVNGIMEVYLNAANTVAGQVGREVYYEVKTQAVNVNFDSGTEEKSTGAVLLGTLIASETKGQTFA